MQTPSAVATYSAAAPSAPCSGLSQDFTDGSHKDGIGGWAAIIVTDVASPVQGLPVLPSGHQGIAGASRSIGASSVTSGTMEIVALREALSFASDVRELNVYTDYERGVKLWKKLGKLSTRELIRGADVPSTISLGELKVSRKLALCSTKVIKVAAHGRDAEQDGRLTEGNAAADEAARTATLSEPDASSAFVLPGPPFVLTLDGLPVYGDPRKAARQQIGSLRMERWRLLPTHGLYARLLPAAWGPSVRFNSSKLALASPPDGVTASFLIRWRLFCLRTPTQLARTEDSVAEFLDRDADGDATCPLCRSMRDGPAARGDTQHILLACPCLENTRQSVRHWFVWMVAADGLRSRDTANRACWSPWTGSR